VGDLDRSLTIHDIFVFFFLFFFYRIENESSRLCLKSTRSKLVQLEIRVEFDMKSFFSSSSTRLEFTSITSVGLLTYMTFFFFFCCTKIILLFNSLQQTVELTLNRTKSKKVRNLIWQLIHWTWLMKQMNWSWPKY
jgi:hypothetical protein